MRPIDKAIVITFVFWIILATIYGGTKGIIHIRKTMPPVDKQLASGAYIDKYSSGINNDSDYLCEDFWKGDTNFYCSQSEWLRSYLPKELIFAGYQAWVYISLPLLLGNIPHSPPGWVLKKPILTSWLIIASIFVVSYCFGKFTKRPTRTAGDDKKPL